VGLRSLRIINSLVIVRSVTRISHARGNVILGELPREKRTARYDTSKIFIPVAAPLRHLALHLKLKKVQEMYETSPSTGIRGREKPELLIVTSGSGWFYSRRRPDARPAGPGWGPENRDVLASPFQAPGQAYGQRQAGPLRRRGRPLPENNVKELAAE